LRGVRKSGGSSEGLWKVDVTEGQESGHKAVAARSDAIEPGTGNLGDEAVATKLGDEPGRALAAAADISGRRMRVEQRGEVAVTEAVEEMTAVEGGGEESSVVRRDGVEAGDSSLIARSFIISSNVGDWRCPRDHGREL
jgi:hypothetical protein